MVDVAHVYVCVRNAVFLRERRVRDWCQSGMYLSLLRTDVEVCILHTLSVYRGNRETEANHETESEEQPAWGPYP